MVEKAFSYENIDLEFKEIYVDDIKKEVIAFANTEGGILYVGVRRDGVVVGVDNIDEVMQKIANSLKDSVAPDIMPFVTIKAIECSNKAIIEVAVNSGSSKPYYIKEKGLKPSGVYVRKGSSCQPLSDEGIRQLIVETSGNFYESSRSMNQQLTFSALAKAFELRNLPLGTVQMQNMKLIGADGLYTNLGLLLSDQCEHTIKVAVFQGRTKMVFRNRQEFSGSLVQQLDDVYSFIDKYNQIKASFSGLLRTDKYDYPQDAVREALINSITHRDYGFSASTLINIFDDKIEFISLGGLVKGMKLETIMIGASQSRNPDLAAVLYRMQLIESFGTGIGKIYAGYAGEEHQPEFIAVYGGFKVTLPNRNNGPEQIMVHEAPAVYAVRPPSNEKQAILEHVRAHGKITRKEAEAVLQVKTTKAFNVLRQLCEENKLQVIGVGRSSKYVIKE